MSDSSEESYESSGQQPVFDIDQLSVDSDNQKAIEYLQKVRQEAQMAPKCTYFEEGQDFQAKQTDAKYLVTPRGVKLNGKWAMNPLWQKDVVEQYVKFKENIEQFRKLDSNSYLLQNVDEQVEKEISKSIVSKVLFREIAKTISPTLLSISKLDYTQSTNIIKWLCNTQRYNYHQSLWIYGALTQLEDPLDADVMGNMNRVLQNCYNIECGTSSVLITIIQLIFKQKYAD